MSMHYPIPALGLFHLKFYIFLASKLIVHLL